MTQRAWFALFYQCWSDTGCLLHSRNYEEYFIQTDHGTALVLGAIVGKDSSSFAGPQLRQHSGSEAR